MANTFYTTTAIIERCPSFVRVICVIMKLNFQREYFIACLTFSQTAE